MAGAIRIKMQCVHYDLKRIKARTKNAEILYIFFGIHTANVVQLLGRIDKRARQEAA